MRCWHRGDGGGVGLIIISLIYRDHVVNYGRIEWMLTNLRLRKIKGRPCSMSCSG